MCTQTHKNLEGTLTGVHRGFLRCGKVKFKTIIGLGALLFFILYILHKFWANRTGVKSSSIIPKLLVEGENHLQSTCHLFIGCVVAIA